MTKPFSLRRLLAVILAVPLLAGIRLYQSWPNHHGDASDDAWFSDEAAETPSELSRAIEVAREYINQQSRTPLDATYTAKRTADGYRVFVGYVGGYDDEGRPLHVAGGHCLLDVSENWQVGRVIR